MFGQLVETKGTKQGFLKNEWFVLILKADLKMIL